ncbi:MAG: DUF3313 family protein [Lysobacterales bacterium]
MNANSPCRLLLSLLTLLLSACASAPKLEQSGFSSPVELSPVREDSHARVNRYLQPSLLAAARSVAPPEVLSGTDLADPAISAEQSALVANRAARDLCRRLSSHFLIVTGEQAADLRIELLPIGMRATGRGAAGFSALADIVVPGPFRLPAGLGGLAMAARVIGSDGQPALVETWSRGANAVTDNAQISSIGDAYQLAGTYARELARVLTTAGFDQDAPRPRLAQDQIKAGRALCQERFGAASMAGRGAAWLLPLAPEAIDDGAAKADDVSIGDDADNE